MINSPNYTPSTSATSMNVPPVATATAIFFNPNSKDTGWLTLDVCREFTRNKCSRADHQCRYAHPTPNVEIQNGKVTCCFDSIKGKCQRRDPPCKYLHPPQHLKEQLLQNGRNNLMLRHQHMQFVNTVLQQQQQLIPAPTAIYPVVYDANGNKAYSNPVTFTSLSDAHFYQAPYVQQGMYYAPFATTQQHLQQQFNVLAPEPPLYNCPSSEVNNPSGSPVPPNEQPSSNQHLRNQARVPAPSDTLNLVPLANSRQDPPKVMNKVQYYPTLPYNPYNNTNNDNNGNYYSCQQMAYATIPATGYAFPVAISGHPSPATIMPRY